MFTSISSEFLCTFMMLVLANNPKNRRLFPKSTIQILMDFSLILENKVLNHLLACFQSVKCIQLWERRSKENLIILKSISQEKETKRKISKLKVSKKLNNLLNRQTYQSFFDLKLKRVITAKTSIILDKALWIFEQESTKRLLLKYSYFENLGNSKG